MSALASKASTERPCTRLAYARAAPAATVCSPPSVTTNFPASMSSPATSSTRSTIACGLPLCTATSGSVWMPTKYGSLPIPMSYSSMFAEASRIAPAPGAQVEVVPPGGDLAVLQFEDAGDGQLHGLASQCELVHPLRQHDIVVHRDLENNELPGLGRLQEHIQHRPDGGFALDPRHGHIVIDRILGEELEDLVRVPAAESVAESGND